MVLSNSVEKTGEQKIKIIFGGSTFVILGVKPKISQMSVSVQNFLECPHPSPPSLGSKMNRVIVAPIDFIRNFIDNHLCSQIVAFLDRSIGTVVVY